MFNKTSKYFSFFDNKLIAKLSHAYNKVFSYMLLLPVV